MKIEAGKTYKDGYGDEYKLRKATNAEQSESGAGYIFRSDTRSYQADGRWYAVGLSKLDLISEVKPKAAPKKKPAAPKRIFEVGKTYLDGCGKKHTLKLNDDLDDEWRDEFVLMDQHGDAYKANGRWAPVGVRKEEDLIPGAVDPDVIVELKPLDPPTKPADPVNHPQHYAAHPSGIECITITESMSFCLGNAIKYIWRADLKGNAIEDLEKSIWYIQRELAKRKKQQPQTTKAA